MSNYPDNFSHSAFERKWGDLKVSDDANILLQWLDGDTGNAVEDICRIITNHINRHPDSRALTEAQELQLEQEVHDLFLDVSLLRPLYKSTRSELEVHHDVSDPQEWEPRLDQVERLRKAREHGLRSIITNPATYAARGEAL